MLLAVIGGSGLGSLPSAKVLEQLTIETAYSERPVLAARIAFPGSLPFIFLPRHGPEHNCPPHLINYRANIDALRTLGVTQIIAVYAVGGIHQQLGPGSIAIPDQLIDYSYGRESSFHSADGEAGVVHVDFSYPYDESVRDLISESLTQAGIQRHCMPQGVYGCTQGPRLETAAEIRRMRTDGCDMVGMTAMPEAVLAREAGLELGALAFSVNWAAGLSDELIDLDEIHRLLADGMADIESCLAQAASLFKA